MNPVNILLGLLATLASSLVVAAPAQKIVSLAPNLTELAFDAGVGDRIVATVDYSNYPEAARRIPRIGDAFRVDFERVLALAPDLVLAWETGTPVANIERLRTLELNVVTVKTQRLSDVSRAVRTIGELAGAPRTANAAAEKFDAAIAALRAQYRNRPTVSVFLQINDRPLYTVNGGHIMSEIVELCGGRNVFAGLAENAPLIGVEAVIVANPQAILSTDDTVPDALTSWRKWTSIEAVRTRNVYTLRSDDIARATLRLTTAAATVCRTLDTVRERLASAPPR